MNHAKLRKVQSATQCEIRSDGLTRQLYATDASIYQIEPAAVAFPKSADETASLLAAAYDEDLPVIPRGAGTGLNGGAVGPGLVIDFSRYNQDISDFDGERKTIRVGAGVVLDRLNAFVRPHGLTFGPDVATSSRATLGGMIANNSSGARAPIYGTTCDHIESLDLVLPGGRRATVGTDEDDLADVHEAVGKLVEQHGAIIEERFPPGLVKGWPGYGFESWLRRKADLTQIVGGSEGTLAAITSAKLKLSPLPKKKSMGVIFFASVSEAMTATVDLLDLKPAAIEHIDRLLLDQTKGQLAFGRARALLRLDEEPCEALLLVELYDDEEGRLEALMERPLGLRKSAFTIEEDMEQIWFLRKAGLSLLTGCKGDAKPTAGIEDVAVLPKHLPDYVAGLKSIMKPLGLQASFYGHAASGLLHVRPVVDLHNAGDIRKYRQLADEVSSLVRQFKGSLAAEHGVGIARTQYLADHLGPELMDATQVVKSLFDPKNLMNPGKIVANGAYRIDRNLRQGEDSPINLPFNPVLAFAAKDESFVGHLEQCNGCGGCLKTTPTMCPTFVATGEEIMSTRGRAATIRAVLDGRLGADKPLHRSEDLAQALDFCLSCKACTTECPSNVNMALLKAELLHAQQKVRGLSLAERALSRVDLLGELASRIPNLTNALLSNKGMRLLLESLLGLTRQRPLPSYATDRFDGWFRRRKGIESGARGTVLLWDDCFVRFNEPQIGRAAVRVLEALRFEVRLPSGRACCGRPAFSMGRLDVAAHFGRQNAEVLSSYDPRWPVVFLEASCYSMFVEDYRELGVARAAEMAERCHLFEDFVYEALNESGEGPSMKPIGENVAIHGHCHAKSLGDLSPMVDLASRCTKGSAQMMNTGCCGMAGAFGAMAKTYDLSLSVAEPLVDQLASLAPDTIIVASGTSCRHQVTHLTERKPLHMAELLAATLEA